MEEIILSFKPEFFRALLTQKKHFEYRSRIPEQQTVAYLYLSAPAKMIVGKMVMGKRNEIKSFLNDSDLNNDYYLNLNNHYRDLNNHYREGAKYFSAIHSLSLLDSPVLLEEAKKMSPNFSAPQGYSYIKNYQKLHEYLEKADYSLFEINPDESLEFLGLFTRDIVNKFSQEIETPSFLEKFI